MTREKITVSELLTREIDIDVYDDVCEELFIAFCGPVELTEAGKNYFAEVLSMDIFLKEERGYLSIATVSLEGPSWEHKLRIAKEFFEAAAGYCSTKDYERWFVQ